MALCITHLPEYYPLTFHPSWSKLRVFSVLKQCSPMKSRPPPNVRVTLHGGALLHNVARQQTNQGHCNCSSAEFLFADDGLGLWGNSEKYHIKTPLKFLNTDFKTNYYRIYNNNNYYRYCIPPYKQSTTEKKS